MKTIKKVDFAKLLPILTLIVSVGFFSSCEKDEDGDAVLDAASIIGTWTATETVVDMTINDVSFVDYLVDEADMSQADAEVLLSGFEADMDMEGTIEFKEDGSFSTNWVGEDPEAGTWVLSNENTTLTITVDGIDGSEVMVFDVISSNSSLLTIEQTVTETEDMNQDGTDETLAITMRMSFSK